MILMHTVPHILRMLNSSTVFIYFQEPCSNLSTDYKIKGLGRVESRKSLAATTSIKKCNNQNEPRWFGRGWVEVSKQVFKLMLAIYEKKKKEEFYTLWYLYLYPVSLSTHTMENCFVWVIHSHSAHIFYSGVQIMFFLQFPIVVRILNIQSLLWV